MITETLVVYRPAPGGKHGDPSGPDVPHSLPDCIVAPGYRTVRPRSATVRGGYDEVTTSFITIFTAPDSDLKAYDKVGWRGNKYTVTGAPVSWGPNPYTGRYPGMQCIADLITG